MNQSDSLTVAFLASVAFSIGFLFIAKAIFRVSKREKSLNDIVELQKEQLRILRKVYPEHSEAVKEERKTETKGPLSI